MSKFCPITNSKVVYLVCQECEDRVCERHHVAILPKKNKELKENAQPQNVVSNPITPTHKGDCDSCSTCCHKLSDEIMQLFGKEMHVTHCRVYGNQLVDETLVSHNGCEYHNKNMSDEKLCMNCEHYIGGGDWGLACAKHYHKLPRALSMACEDFQKKI